MKILGIDTSCDDTSIAILNVINSNFEIISNIVSSQVKLHQKYGGVYPFLAKREHQKNLPTVFNKAKKGYKLSDIDLVGFTMGPGLEPCLWQGINFAKELIEKTKKPYVPVNHIEAHILANYIERSQEEIKFPAMCLVVSGGHTTLFLMKEIGSYKLIGETLDDAAGEAFDKVARILNLGYPGGPLIAKEAEKYKGNFSVKLPRPMIHQKNYNFSFSGLKTAVLYNYKSQAESTKKKKEYIQALSFETQQSIIDVLVYKTLKAAKDYKVKTIMLGGGVSANEKLRQEFNKESVKNNFDFIVPSKNFCTDNGAMIAVAAYFHRNDKPMDLNKISAQGNLFI